MSESIYCLVMVIEQSITLDNVYIMDKSHIFKKKNKIKLVTAEDSFETKPSGKSYS